MRCALAGRGRAGKEDEPVEPKRLDKPDNEPAGNVDIYGGMHLAVWITGDGLPSDRAENLHTHHPDEPGPTASCGTRSATTRLTWSFSAPWPQMTGDGGGG